MKPETRYTPTETGFAVSGSSEIFNRTLYGSHQNDNDGYRRYFTFAGDAPYFMGAYSNPNNYVAYSKRGVLSSGLAITPGKRYHFYYSKDIDQTSRWFHNSEDIRTEFKNGWLEYELSHMSSWFPDVRVNIEAYPLNPDDGFLVHYKITTDQRVHFVAGFGGIDSKYIRPEYKGVLARNFSADDCKENTVVIGDNRAVITHPNGAVVRIAASFPCDFALGSAESMAEPYPSMFMVSTPKDENDNVVRISSVIEPGKPLDGYIIVTHNADESVIDKWLAKKNPIAFLKERLYEKYACIDVSTPERSLDLTVAPTVMAIDASWHKDAFCHGAYAYHAPFLGWRNWYAPTLLGWHERVAATIHANLSSIKRGDISKERVWYDDSPIPEGKNRFDRRFHYIENDVGRLSSHRQIPLYSPYNMQECALDMMLYYIEWTGDLKIAEEHYDDMCSMANFETRIYDYDNDGLYQNVLNTWISDGHNYNGGGCAQSSAYNYRANLVISKIAKKLGKLEDSEFFAKRAEKIKKAVNEKLWVAQKGVIAESIDVIGNCMRHESPELPTVYHIIDSDVIDDFRAYMTLRFTENCIKNIETVGSGGRLCFSSNWLPKQYSNCGIFPAENAHLALVYYKLGLFAEGKKLLDGIADCYFTGRNPGMAAHIQSARGTCDFGDQDFSDVSSTYLRLVAEGLFGIRINNLDNLVNIAPGFPEEWEHASLSLKDISVHYNRRGNQEIFDIYCDKSEIKRIRIPMRSSALEAVLLDGAPVDYEISAAPNNSFIFVNVDKVGKFQLRVMHSNVERPYVDYPNTVLSGNKLCFELCGADVADVFDVSECLENITVTGNKIYAVAKDVNGPHTLFIRARSGEYDAWLAADYKIIGEDTVQTPMAEEESFVPVDISEYFNCEMTEIHNQTYAQPRPEGFSMGMYQNARYSHNWNQCGRNVVCVDDSKLRNCGGIIKSPSGIPFITPPLDNNVACVSIWDVFPTELNISLEGKGRELAVFYVASSCCMHSYVDNARITVTYKDGSETSQTLIYPVSLDDWLTSALTTEGEIFYFSDFNHGTVQRLKLDPEKELASVRIEAVANELVLGVAGISVSR